MRVLSFFIVSLFTLNIQAQDNLESISDSLEMATPFIESFTTVSKIDYNKATMYAAVLPGLGKIYNKQYWKIPIVYGGFIMFAHYINQNNNLYHAFKNAYRAEIDNNPNTINPYPQFVRSSLQRNAERFKRNRDFVMIWMGIFYLINIVETHVAAHLREFEVNDDLTIKIRPGLFSASQFSTYSIGFSITIPLNK